MKQLFSETVESSDTLKVLHNPTAIIIGGGAAGFFCAVNAARLNPHLRVTILEKTGKLLAKVKVSGGGRCNVTHYCNDIAEMAARYPRGMHFVKKSFHRFFTNDTVNWFAERGVKLKTEPDGRMFPVTDNSQTIIDCLLHEARQYKVNIQLHTEVVALQKKDNCFFIELKNGQAIAADFVCVATGGYPKPEMFNWLQVAGHALVPPVPSLFTFNLPQHPLTTLPGISVHEAEVKIAGTKFRETGPLLVTHWGLSGPVILKLSAWAARELAEWQWHFTIGVNWLPRYNENSLREEMQAFRKEKPAQTIYGKPPFELPRRLWEFFLQQSGVSEKHRWADLPASMQNTLCRNICSAQYAVKGKTTFKEEFVTAGGVSLAEVDPQTMQSKKVPALYFAGEALDVDGITGGYNFQNAWTTGWVAAESIAKAGEFR